MTTSDASLDATLDATSVEPPVPARTDGRHARSERSRSAMVDALLDLLREGNLRPSSALIAERAGVTQRTLFNQFGDMETLVAAVTERQAVRIAGLVPDAGTGTLDERVVRYCDGLARLLEESMNLRWVALTNATEWAGPAAVRGARLFMRDRLAQSFDPELATLSDAERRQVIDVLEMETDPAVWRLRRTVQDLTVDQAQACVQRAMLAILRPLDATATAPTA